MEASDEASCTTDITHEPGIDVTKSCPESVPFGEDIEYTITVTNTGNEALEGVTVDDTLLGDITGEFDFDFSNPSPSVRPRRRRSPTRRRPATPTRSPTR